MENKETLEHKSVAEQEEWFLASLSESQLPVDAMIDLLAAVLSQGEADRGEEWSDLLLEELIERADRKAARRLLGLKVEWHSKENDYRKTAAEISLKIYDDRLGKTFVQSVGFEDRGVKLEECLRRLDVLTGLSKGTMVYDKTWGFGIVKTMDDFYKKITIDFDKKPGHQFSFAYASEALRLLGDTHLLALRHRNPDGLAKMIQDDPGELVRVALRSFGPMSVPELQELLSDRIVDEAGWKGFWDRARKQLKADPLIDVPAKRNDPIKILEKEKAYDDSWFVSLSRECDVNKILSMVEGFEREGDMGVLLEHQVESIVERLAFAAKADVGSNYGRLARTIIILKRLDIGTSVIDIKALMDGFFREEVFLDATSDMSAKAVEQFVRLLAGHNMDAACGLFARVLSRLPMIVLNVVADYLVSVNETGGIVAYVDEAFLTKSAVPEVLYWLCRHREEIAHCRPITSNELLVQIIASMDGRFSGERLKTTNQLKALFEQKSWLKTMLDDMSPEQRAEILGRIRASRGWDVSSTRSVLAKMVVIYPELAQIMIEERSDAAGTTVKGLYTSIRSYRERQAQLMKLVNEDIPANSREIGIARSYGDLRENAEYDAAKQHQALLMRKKSELELDLTRFRETDFSGMFTGKAGMGTCVKIRKPGGEEILYNILGEWDRDESLNIISSRSKVAEILDGRSSGEEVELPSSTGVEKCIIVEINALSDVVKKWIQGQ